MAFTPTDRHLAEAAKERLPRIEREISELTLILRALDGDHPQAQELQVHMDRLQAQHTELEAAIKAGGLTPGKDETAQPASLASITESLGAASP